MHKNLKRTNYEKLKTAEQIDTHMKENVIITLSRMMNVFFICIIWKKPKRKYRVPQNFKRLLQSEVSGSHEVSMKMKVSIILRQTVS